MIKTELVKQYMPLADSMATIKKKKFKNIYLEEFQSAAYLGLVNAAHGYIAEISPFEHYARKHISGAMDDYLRDIRWGSKKKYREFISLNIEDGDALVNDIPDIYHEHSWDDLTENLCEQGKKIIRLYYEHGFSLKEISIKMNITISGISQLIKSYQNKIKENYA